MRKACVALVFAVGACALPNAETVPPSPWIAELAAVRADTPTGLPAQLPPGFEGVTVGTGNGLPLVSFHAAGEPTVTLCTGDPFACRGVVTVVEEIDVADADGAPVLVFVDDAEGGSEPLSVAARIFWERVEFTTSVPGWLLAR